MLSIIIITTFQKKRLHTILNGLDGKTVYAPGAVVLEQ
jgi:hypothetical protein